MFVMRIDPNVRRDANRRLLQELSKRKWRPSDFTRLMFDRHGISKSTSNGYLQGAAPGDINNMDAIADVLELPFSEVNGWWKPNFKPKTSP